MSETFFESPGLQDYKPIVSDDEKPSRQLKINKQLLSIGLPYEIYERYYKPKQQEPPTMNLMHKGHHFVRVKFYGRWAYADGHYITVKKPEGNYIIGTMDYVFEETANFPTRYESIIARPIGFTKKDEETLIWYSDGAKLSSFNAVYIDYILSVYPIVQAMLLPFRSYEQYGVIYYEGEEPVAFVMPVVADPPGGIMEMHERLGIRDAIE